MILGLDISTSCTGWCVLSSSGSLVDMGHILLSQEKSMFKKTKIVKQVLAKINIDHNIEKIFIEENLQKFRPGFSSAKTIVTLARFNGIVSYVAQDEFFIAPEFINVNIARKSLGIKIVSKKKGGKPTKEQVLEWVSSNLKELNLKEYSWPQKVLKSGPRKGQTVLQPYCYDMADAYVISLAGQKLKI